VTRFLPLVLAVLAAGCGGTSGASDGTTAPATTATPTAIQTVTVPDTAQPQATPSGQPSFRVELTAESPTATAGQPWEYTVRATDEDGSPAAATAKMRVFKGDELIDTLGWFPFDGTLRETHRWPRSLAGEKVVLQAEVEGSGGTQRANVDVEIR
jgi:hypothetical protein